MPKLLKSVLVAVLLGFNGQIALGAPPPPPPPALVNTTTVDSDVGKEDMSPQTFQSEQKVFEEAPSRMLSGLGQTGGGMIGGLGLGVGGVLVGAALCANGDGFSDLACALGLGLVGAAVGTPLGVWTVGEWIGWDGSILATIGGTLVGALIFGMIGESLSHSQSTETAGITLFVIGVPATGAAGYQLFADWPKAEGALVVPKSTAFTIIDLKF